MPLHPTSVRWFEASIPRHQVAYALEALAGAEIVQLEDTYLPQPEIDKGELRQHLNRYDLAVERYGRLLPKDDLTPSQQRERPEQLAAETTDCLRSWCAGLLRLQRRMRDKKRERENLELLDECLVAMHGASERMDAMRTVTPFLYKNVFSCPKGQLVELETNTTVNEIYYGDQHDFWIVAGEPTKRYELRRIAASLECKSVGIPEWFSARISEQHQKIIEHLNQIDSSIAKISEDLTACLADLGIREAMANRRILRWYLDDAIGLMPEQETCRLHGWTTTFAPSELRRILEDIGVNASVEFGQAPTGLSPPVILTASRRVRPFQLFVKLLGTPGRNEIDPTPLLAILVPLLFGFMFPDFGHGLVLAFLGTWISRKNPDAMVLVYCGISAAGFGLFFGEFFGIQDLLPAICGCPLDHPVEVLLATLLVGIGVILLGLCFSGIEAYWRGELGVWSLDGAPVLLLYIAAACTLIWHEAKVAIFIALVWYTIGIVVLCRKSDLRCVRERLGHLLQSAFQLIINTLSFMRVGAFALGHSAFSVVVLELMQSTQNLLYQLLIFVIGHAFVILLEGLIVMIQTSRLILFEFFIRFLRFEGRIYKPLTRVNTDARNRGGYA